MKGLILSGGSGTRMMPLTSTCPKQLLPILNKPIIINIIEMLKEAGIKDIIVIVGETYPKIYKHLGDGQKWGVKIQYQYQAAPLGLAHAVKIAKELLEKDDFVMVLGDNYFKVDLREIIDIHNSKFNQATIAIKEVTEPERFGIAYIADSKIVKVIEKPQNPTSNLAILGLYVFNNNKIFEAIDKIGPSWRNELEITDAIQEILTRGNKLGYYMLGNNWLDVGTPEDLLSANIEELGKISSKREGSVDEKSTIIGDVIIEEGAQIINSTLVGPIYVGRDTLIQNSTIQKNTCIGDRCKIISSSITDTLILSEVSIYNHKDPISNCIVGENSIIQC